MKDDTMTFVGIDVSKDNLAIAVAEGGLGGEVLSLVYAVNHFVR